jgi:hypothetical protein
MKKLMTHKWFKEVFIEETKKQLSNVISIGYEWDSYIVEKDIVEEGENITGKSLEVSWFGLKRKAEETGHKFKKYKLIFKYNIRVKDNNYKEPTEYDVYLYLNKIFTCDKAEILEKSLREKLDKEGISDTVRFTFIKDSTEEIITIKEDSFRRVKNVN